MSKIYATLLLSLVTYCIISTTSKAQLISEDRKADWNIVGAQVHREAKLSESPIELLDNDAIDENLYNIVQDFEADNKGKEDISDILQHALDVTPPGSVIYFPTGVYLIKKTIRVPGDKIIRGRSPNTTYLHFDLGGKDHDLFSIAGNAQREYVSVVEMGKKGSFLAKVSDASGFDINDDVELEQENNPAIYTNPLWDQNWAQWAVGQLLYITEMQGNQLRFDRSFSIDYDDNFLIRLQKVNLVKNVGFERFTIERLDGGRGNNFRFFYAANAWIKCIHSKKASRSHVRIEKSRNCSVTGSYFEDAHYHCAAGAGYGINCLDHTSECLIENNIFKRLRHSMMVKEGATRNVFAYNYSFETATSEGTIANGQICTGGLRFWPMADISLHGHYPSMNLFEHNIVQHIGIADYWGPSGPGNTIFRNKVESERSIAVLDYSANQNIIANEVIDTIAVHETVSGAFLFGNRLLENNIYASVGKENIPDSFYKLKKPDFYANEPWPSIGPEYSSDEATIPALERWKKKKIFDRKCCGDITGLSSVISYFNDLIIFFEHDQLFIEYPVTKLVDLLITTVEGKTIFSAQRVKTNQAISINNRLDNGLYLINVYDYDNQVRNIVKILKL